MWGLENRESPRVMRWIISGMGKKVPMGGGGGGGGGERGVGGGSWTGDLRLTSFYLSTNQETGPNEINYGRKNPIPRKRSQGGLC